MAAENETLKFKIGDEQYEMPVLDDLDMDEWQILYEYTGLILDDFAPAEDQAPVTEDEIRLTRELKEAKTPEAEAEIGAQLSAEQSRRMKNDGPDEQERRRRTSQPGFMRAMLHIGYRRAHPDLKPDAIKQVTGAAKLIHVIGALNETAPEEEETPLASTTEPAPSSKSGSVASNENASKSSATSSARPAARPEPTGISG